MRDTLWGILIPKVVVSAISLWQIHEVGVFLLYFVEQNQDTLVRYQASDHIIVNCSNLRWEIPSLTSRCYGLHKDTRRGCLSSLSSVQKASFPCLIVLLYPDSRSLVVFTYEGLCSSDEGPKADNYPVICKPCTGWYFLKLDCCINITWVLCQLIAHLESNLPVSFMAH